MNPIAASSREHVAQLAALLEGLASQEIGLYEHRYDALVFGSFQITPGLPHQRVRFTWEGRDATLGVEFQTLKSQQNNAAWVHDAYISVPNHADVYAEIDSEACRMHAALAAAAKVDARTTYSVSTTRTGALTVAQVDGIQAQCRSYAARARMRCTIETMYGTL